MRESFRQIFRSSKMVTRHLLRGYAGLAWGREKDFRPRVVVPINGGLGNQIWQYAIGMGASFFSGLPVEYDLSWYEKYGMDIHAKEKRVFDILKVFPSLPLPIADAGDAKWFRRYLSCEPRFSCIYDQSIYHGTHPRYLGGFCAHARYMCLLGEDLWGRFSFDVQLDGPNETLRDDLPRYESVAVHVRRGDYVGSMHDVLTPGYYRRAMDYLAQKLSPKHVVFYVFSNGMDWAREHLSGAAKNIVFVEQNGNDAVVMDFYLMTQCKHHIIANSTLSWFGAWFCVNPEKLVVMPSRWFNAKAPRDIVHGSERAFRVDSWITLAVE